MAAENFHIKALPVTLLLLSLGRVAYSITCLSCGKDGVDELSSCKQIVECGAGHTCYIERALSLRTYRPKFKAGCREVHECNLITCSENAFGKTFPPHQTTPVPKLGKRDGLVICTECCYNDTCNTRGCGANFTVTGSSSALLQCFQCTHQRPDSRPCAEFSSCQSGESCLYDYKVHVDGPPFFELGCMSTAFCDYLQANTNEADRTSNCCDDHLCNQSPYKTANTSETLFEALKCPTDLVQTTTTTTPRPTTTTTTTTPKPTTTSTTTTTTTPTPTTTTTAPTPVTTPTPTTTTTTPTTTPTPTTTTTTPTTTPTPTTTTTIPTTTSTPTTTTTTPTTTPAPTTTTTTPTTTSTPTTTTTTPTTTLAPTTTTTTPPPTTTTTTPTTTPPPTTTTTTSTTTPPPTTTTTTPAPTTTTTPTPTTTAPITTPTPTSTIIANTTAALSRDSITCQVCSGPSRLCDRLHHPTTCVYPNNFCVNHLVNLDSGARDLERKCGDIDTCVHEWFQGTSDNDRCTALDEHFVQTLAFECTFCCTTDNCNLPIVPEKESLFKN